FRFKAQDIYLFLPYFDLSHIRFRNGYSCPPETALCLLLYRLSAPNQLKENMKIFQHSCSSISSIFNNVIEYLIEKYSKHIEWDNIRLSRKQILKYSDMIERKGVVKSVWGFIDGTIRTICRPIHHQQYYYSGYKKYHTFKFQAVMIPDGIISYLAGTWFGQEGDWSMYIDSKLESHLRDINDGSESHE
ncbi:hypothetical protein C7212DRAFT_209210, partial [Tuber magnatum]